LAHSQFIRFWTGDDEQNQANDNIFISTTGCFHARLLNWDADKTSALKLLTIKS
jgi:hypothetical protein